ncbi:MAG: permease [Kordiimonas sp.]|nr:permease [Kordiimonas sp.]|tara:strand:- start:2536 stop:3594 length:1059 start_codon:yes stop_codon:yes gene_type:complete
MSALAYASSFGIAALSVLVLVLGRDMLVPLAIAIVIWYLINALSDALRKISISGRRLPAKLSFALSLVIMIIALAGISEMISQNIAAVRDAAPTYQENFQVLAHRLLLFLGFDSQLNFAQLIDQIDVAPFITNIASTLANIAGNAGLIIIYVLFLILEQNSFDHKLQALFPDSERLKTVRELLADIGEKIEVYVWIKTLVSILTGVVAYTILKMVGVDYASFWAFITFLLNFIPTVGSMLAVIFPAILSLVQFDTLTPFFIVLICLSSIQFVIGNVLEPRLMGNSLNLSPLVVILSLVLWGNIWGIVGMFLSVPVTVILMIVMAHFPRTRPFAILLSQDGLVKSIPIDQVKK